MFIRIHFHRPVRRFVKVFSILSLLSLVSLVLIMFSIYFSRSQSDEIVRTGITILLKLFCLSLLKWHHEINVEIYFFSFPNEYDTFCIWNNDNKYTRKYSNVKFDNNNRLGEILHCLFDRILSYVYWNLIPVFFSPLFISITLSIYIWKTRRICRELAIRSTSPDCDWFQ